MSIDNGQLSELARIAALMRDRALARLALHDKRAGEIRSEIAELRRGRAPVDGASLGLPSGAQTNWETWTDREIMRRNEVLARLMAEREALARDAQLAYGKCNALDLMVDTEAEARRRGRQTS